MNYEQWAARHPVAAAELAEIITDSGPATDPAVCKSEAWAQQQARLAIAHSETAPGYRALSWRNNVGVTPDKCEECGAKLRPVRYGLANDSKAVNSKIKSSDLILAIPRLIRPQDVGTVIAQFGSVETKRPGWTFTGKGREAGQAAWLALINKIGGYGKFSTGEVKL